MLQNYLSQYGYLPPINPENGAFLSEEKLTTAIEEFQAFAGLNITGMLNFIYLSKFILKHIAHACIYKHVIYMHVYRMYNRRT